MVTRNSSTMSAALGSPDTAMTATSATRIRSQAIMTRRRGSRSARPERAIPPTNDGTTLAAKVTAASRAEWVRPYTSRVSATRASWSPATDRTCASHSARNSLIAKTAPNVALGGAWPDVGGPSVDCPRALASGLIAFLRLRAGAEPGSLVLNQGEGTGRRAGWDRVSATAIAARPAGCCQAPASDPTPARNLLAGQAARPSAPVAQHGTHPAGRLGNRGVPGGTGLLVGERAVGGAEAQPVGEGLVPLPHLLTGVDVEQPDLLQQPAVGLGRPGGQRGLHLGGGHHLADDQRDVLGGDRERGDQRRLGRRQRGGRGADDR